MQHDALTGSIGINDVCAKLDDIHNRQNALEERLQFTVEKLRDIQRLNNTVTMNTGEIVQRLIRSVSTLKDDFVALAGSVDEYQKHTHAMHSLHIDVMKQLRVKEKESERIGELPPIDFSGRNGDN